MSERKRGLRQEQVEARVGCESGRTRSGLATAGGCRSEVKQPSDGLPNRPMSCFSHRGSCRTVRARGTVCTDPAYAKGSSGERAHSDTGPYRFAR